MTEQNLSLTHLQTLRDAATIYMPKTVLELGSGLWSTALFLDRTVFSRLEKLHTVEHNLAWFERISQLYGDARFFISKCDKVSTYVAEMALDKFDMIFVDDSESMEDRSSTIFAVGGKAPTGVVLIHDYEVDSYQSVAKVFPHRLKVFTHAPYMGVVGFTPIDWSAWTNLGHRVEEG